MLGAFGLRRVRVHAGSGLGTRLLPEGWTSLRRIDAFERHSAGRSLLRFDDLCELRELVDALIRKDYPS